jgi:hypothetical protein
MPSPGPHADQSQNRNVISSLNTAGGITMLSVGCTTRGKCRDK